MVVLSQLVSALANGMYYIVPVFYLGVEALFYIAFHKYLIPRANQLSPPAPFRDYGEERSRLLMRVMRRIEATCAMNQENVTITIHRFLAEWFHVAKNQHHRLTKDAAISNFPDLSPTPSTSPENSDDDDEYSQPSLQSPASILSDISRNNSIDKCVSPPITATEPSICLYKEDIDDFFAWAFFGKHYLTMLPWETKELDQIYQLVKREQNMVFPKKPACPRKSKTESFHVAKPRCMTLETANAMHRPLLVYIIVGLVKFFGGILLRVLGYQRLVASTGLVGWYRPGKTKVESSSSSSSSSSYMPLLFFHGIAPGGLILYLPMIFFGLATEPERPVFLFENRSISCSMDFYPLSEEKTVDGIFELVNQALGESSSQEPLSVVGHSFGSCPITWLLASPKMSSRIHQVVLLDPVAILLSEPDVMVNFLYAQEMDKIRMVASSELFTEYYLRRHFAWYNSELWLQDLKEQHKLLVCLSEQDEIINARKVRQELERHASEVPEQHQPKTLYWKEAGHGACISSLSKWRQIKGLMLQQELEILQQRQCTN